MCEYVNMCVNVWLHVAAAVLLFLSHQSVTFQQADDEAYADYAEVSESESQSLAVSLQQQHQQHLQLCVQHSSPSPLRLIVVDPGDSQVTSRTNVHFTAYCHLLVQLLEIISQLPQIP